ncbi:hypothetical protein L227DRAFT_579993 [Lentinus tigrinus ALCF2SS1-6]|uniref:C3H1-type domain-containing protein n=1 Tax=Lentinus tigrinus ALCF2SS1-6 TaxID=1328759 RepID=A0A5C2RTF7_9APHY|nr:hypothetical protein L227DRAFT_579993 [Lentinus tigrinus ALCF2SS1-6]
MAARRGRFRTKLCRNFALGHCPQGEKCNYIHASPETIQTNGIGPLLQTSTSQRSQDDPLSATTFSPLWPTLSPATNTSSDQLPYNWSNSSNAGLPSSRIKYRPLSWRTALCRHFVKNRGWCPLGDACNYIHDLTLAEFAKNDVRFQGRRGERGKAGSKHSHCWAYVQGLCHVQDCQYLHPVAVNMFSAHTPCLAWPNCRRGPLCPFKHPEPYISNSPTTSPAAPSTTLQPNQPSHPDAVPRGAMHYPGMFYFNMSSQPPPSLPPPHPVPPPQAPVMPPPQPPPVIFTNPWEGWQMQMPYTPTAMAYTPVAVTAPAWPSIGFNESSNRPPALPQFSVSTYEDPALFQLPMPGYEDPAPRQAHMSNYTYHPVPAVEEAPKPRAFSTPNEDFPYVPPKEQHNRHAKRVSVSLHNKEAMDALGLDSSSHGRLPWQTHSDRLARRSWAPSSSSLRTAQATPPPVMYGM